MDATERTLDEHVESLTSSLIEDIYYLFGMLRSYDKYFGNVATLPPGKLDRIIAEIVE